jgi:GntR family transcriptional regulator
MLFRVNLAADEALFEQLATQVRLAIVDGDLRHGERLPAAGDVAKALAINVHTVLHAYQVLRDEGLIELRRGRGAVVTSPQGAAGKEVRQALAAFGRAARKAGLTPEACLALVREEMAR